MSMSSVSQQLLRRSFATMHAGPSTRIATQHIPKRAMRAPALSYSTLPTRTAMLLRPETAIRRSSPFHSILQAKGIPARAASSAASTPTSRSQNSSTDDNARGHREEQQPEDDEPPAGGSAYAKFRALSKKYGWWALGMYTFLSSIDFTLSFLLVHAAGAERIEPYLHAGVQKYRQIRHGDEEALRLEQQDKDKAEREAQEEKETLANMTPEERVKHKKAAGSGWGSKTLWAEIALAYAIHKTALLPIRAGLTVAITPRFVKWMAARGWVGKGGITRAATHAQGKIRNASDRVKDAVKRD